MKNVEVVNQIIEKLKLAEHPEGGYYKEVYRSEMLISNKELGKSFNGDRNVSTSIYFLLTSDTFSAFHKIKQDELWHFYKGTAIEIHIIHLDGKYERKIVGTDLLNHEVPQVVIPANTWFAAKVIQDDSYGLVGCTVAPGFDFRDFELANTLDLRAAFPEYSELIQKFTR